ncbi:MAG: ArsA family ATPase [Myxococcota bacterium]
MSTKLPSLLDRRLIIISGKGGTGKTAAACALAVAASRQGLRTLLVETAPIEAIAANFEARPRPLGYKGRELGPSLHALRIDPPSALAEYVRLQIGLGAVTDRILETETFQQLLEAAPGWRELIILGKIWHLEQLTDKRGRPLYDLIIVDAPATGHGLTFLDVPRVVQSAVSKGPLAQHSSWVEALIHDPKRTLLLPVTLPEELPMLETQELVTRAREDLGIAVDRIIVNRMPEEKDDAPLSVIDRMPDDLEFAGLPSVPEIRALLEQESDRADHARERRREVSERCNLPVVDLPALAGGYAAESDWSASADQILASPVWPTASGQGESS